MTHPTEVFLIAGARPNFMKIAPIWEEMKKHPARFRPIFVHTGQHYDDRMSRVFLRDLGLPEPDIYLGVGSGSHALQTARIMIQFEKVMVKDKPDLVMVVGDVNSTLACALVSSKIGVPVAHVEAGLRSFDRRMPEEINRILTDQISDYLFTTCEEANENLKREGIPEERIHFVGNLMIQSLLKYRQKTERSHILQELGLDREQYCLVTLHRPSNVDQRETFQGILKALYQIQHKIKVVFPAHPRTQRRMRQFGLGRSMAQGVDNFMIIDPLGYLDFLCLQMNARFLLTDSGGIQEESTFFGVPCLTLRENTERPITVTQGTNTLVGTDSERIIKESLKIISGGGKRGRVPELWDDRVAQRIVRVLPG